MKVMYVQLYQNGKHIFKVMFKHFLPAGVFLQVSGS